MLLQMQIAHNQRFHKPTSYSKRNSRAHVSRTSSSKSIGNNEPGHTLLNFGHSVSNEAMPMQIAGPGNRANPLHIVLPTCLRPFRTTIRNRPATQAATQAIELARLLLLPERHGPISRVGNIKPRVGMSILLASIQITTPRAHRRRLSSILKPLREGADQRDILTVKRRVCKIVCVSPLKGQRLRRRSSPAQGAGHATMAAAWPAADWRRP